MKGRTDHLLPNNEGERERGRMSDAREIHGSCVASAYRREGTISKSKELRKQGQNIVGHAYSTLNGSRARKDDLIKTKGRKGSLNLVQLENYEIKVV